MALSWSSLVGGDEQLDQPNSQTSIESCMLHLLYEFFGFNINTTDFAWADPAFIYYY